MPRAAAHEAGNAQKTAGENAATYGGRATSEFGPLSSQANSLINSPGFAPDTMSAITNAGMGATNAPFADAASQINRDAARSGNIAGTAGNLDALATEKGLAGGQEAGNINIANANYQNNQRMAGLNILNSLYGTNTGAQTANEGVRVGGINAQTAASPGWVQSMDQTLSAISGLVPKGSYSLGGSGGGGGATA